MRTCPNAQPLGKFWKMPKTSVSTIGSMDSPRCPTPASDIPARLDFPTYRWT